MASRPDPAALVARIDAQPRLGWLREPTPVSDLPELAAALGLASLVVKRDDLLPALFGGSKPRKLDFLLASARFSTAPRWAGVGAIGSGNLVALTAAASRLERRLEAYTFWTPLSAESTDNLAFVSCGPAKLHYFRSRAHLALAEPRALLGPDVDGVPVIEPGATTPVGMLGMARAGLELAQQIDAGVLTAPDRIYVSFGSGGTAVGIATGLALAGLSIDVIGVCAVERVFATSGRVRRLKRALFAELSRAGIEPPTTPLRLRLDHGEVGPGYAHPTAESLEACARVGPAGPSLEPAYTGKAMAALLRDTTRQPGGRWLFWHTARRALPASDEHWRLHLPPELARHLELAGPPPTLTRRRVLVASVALVAGGVSARMSGYPRKEDWSGKVLEAWEAHVLQRAAEVLVPALGADVIAQVPLGIDRYLVGFSPDALREIHALIGFLEQSPLLQRRWHRFSLLPPLERQAVVAWMDKRGGLLADAARGLRDLVLVGAYQQPATWGELGYPGPRVPLDYDPAGPARMAWPAYDALVAPPGSLPPELLP